MSRAAAWTPPPFDAARIAAIEVRMGLASSSRCRELYAANCADLRVMAKRADQNKSRKCGGYTSSELLAKADVHEQRGALVAAEVAKLLGEVAP